MKASIIVPTFNRLIFTRICVQFLRTMFADESDVEVIVVDNGSGDGTPEFLRTLPRRIRIVLNQTNRSFATACNQGANVATGESLVFLNNDTVPTEGWLDPLLELLDRPGVGIVAPKLLFPDGTIQHAGVVFTESYIPAHMYYLFPGQYPEANVEREYQAVTGACLAIRQSLFQKLGGFDEEFRNSFEDIDLCLRARVAGTRIIYTPRSTVYHFESASEGRHDRDDANRLRFLHLWKDYVTIDEPDRYRDEGFLAVPRIPVRTLPQAMAQMQMERRQADSLTSLLSSFAHLDQATALPSDPRGRSVAPFLVGPIPDVLAAGIEVTFDVQIVDRGPGRLLPATLRYVWKRSGLSAVSWSNNAAELRAGRGITESIRATILTPSVPDQYELQWLLDFGDKAVLVSSHVISIALSHGIECRARLPSVFIAGRHHRIVVKLKNVGAEPLLAHGGFCVSYHWYDAAGTSVIQWEGIRTPIHERLAYGEETIVEASVECPPLAGRLSFAWDAVNEGQFWFSDVGVPMRCEQVEVHAATAGAAQDQSLASNAADTGLNRGDQTSERHSWELAATLRVRDAALQRAIQDFGTQRDYIENLERRVRASDARVDQMDQLVRAIERGRMMRLLNLLEHWRRRLLPRSDASRSRHHVDF